MKEIKVITFDKKFLPEYVALNREWIEKYFEVEPMDTEQLLNAESSILDQGGEIFFVLEDGRAVGTCAMVPHGPGVFELAKMAVDNGARGQGYGDLLMRATIRWAKEKGARRIMLLSNTLLEPAIRLYHKHGFKTARLGEHPDYKRANIEMTLELGRDIDHQDAETIIRAPSGSG